jgi:stage IV sporulation protein FB
MPDVRRAAQHRPHRWSVPFGRVLGIQLRVHVSFLLLVVLFAAAAPEPGLASGLASLGWLVVIFGCVVAHELAHSLVARRRGAEVDEILLFPLGGVSRLRHLPDSPADELAIAIAGPLTSIGLGVAALGLALARGHALTVDLLTGDWLLRFAWLNLLLGVFNLLPAFPLDGGRVLRALLERSRDVESATRVATRIGHALAAGLIVAGLLLDLWLVLIGLFVYFGASAEEAATIVHARLRGQHVRDAMSAGSSSAPAMQDAPAVDADAPLDEDVLELLQEAPDHIVTVRDHDRVTGVLSADDVMRLVNRTRE